MGKRAIEGPGQSVAPAPTSCKPMPIWIQGLYFLTYAYMVKQDKSLAILSNQVLEI